MGAALASFALASASLGVFATLLTPNWEILQLTCSWKTLLQVVCVKLLQFFPEDVTCCPVSPILGFSSECLL